MGHCPEERVGLFGFGFQTGEELVLRRIDQRDGGHEDQYSGARERDNAATEPRVETRGRGQGENIMLDAEAGCKPFDDRETP
jgi:hypothetical protein